MARIEVSTSIRAPRERVFDLARSIDLHVNGFEAGHHYAIGGVTTGLIGAAEEVEWRGKAFGLWWKHKSRIVAFDAPAHFRDTMIRGAFETYDHDHFFDVKPEGTLMRDVVVFKAPFGPVGQLVDKWLIGDYMYHLILRRAETIKEAAESDSWKRFLLP